MGLHGISQTVDQIQRSIASGIITDGITGASNVVVNGCGNTNNGNPLICQRQQTLEGTVAADANQCVQTQHLAGAHCLIETFFGHKFLAACRVQHGTAASGNIAYTFKIQLHKVAVDQAVIASANADAFNIHMHCCSHYRTDSSIHTGRIATAGKNANTTNCSFHKSFLRNHSKQKSCAL